MNKLILLIVVFLSFAPNKGYSCSCKVFLDAFEENIIKADMVFVGTVASVEFKENSTDIPYNHMAHRVKVHKVYKGVINSTEVNIYTGIGSGDCGFPFTYGKAYLIYANKLESKNTFITDICTPTSIIEDTKQVELDFLRAYTEKVE